MVTLRAPKMLPANGVDENQMRIWRNSMQAYLDQDLDNHLFFPGGFYQNWAASIDNEDGLRIRDVSEEDDELRLINEDATRSEARKQTDKKKLKALRNAQLSKMLQNIANCCHFNFNNEYNIVSKSTSLNWVWNYLKMMIKALTKEELEYKDLLEEVLESIFQYLPYNSLKTAALVCRRWNSVIVNSSMLWSRFNILVNESNASNLEHLRRPIRSVTLSSVSDGILEVIYKREGLKSLPVNLLDKLSTYCAELLSIIVTRMEHFSMTIYSMDVSTLTVFFAKLLNRHTLKSFKLDGTLVNINFVEPKMLCDVLKNIARIELHGYDLTAEQTIEIFNGFCETGKLKYLRLDWTKLSAVEPDLLTQALKHVTRLSLNRTELTANQTRALFSMVHTNISLSELDLGYNNLKSVDPDILSKAIIKLTVICLVEVKMTTVQWTTLFKDMATEQSCLIEADFSINDLSKIDPNIQSLAVTNVIKIKLEDTRLNSQQASLIFYTIANQQTKVKHLDISNTNIEEVNATTLAKCGSKLVSLSLDWPELSDDKLIIFFQVWGSNEVTLKQLKLEGLSLEIVNVYAFAYVINNLEVANLSGTFLTSYQLTALFSKIVKMTSLKELNISSSNLSTVRAELLAEAVNNIERVDLTWTELALNQASAILSQCEKKTKLTYLNMRGNGLHSLEVSSEIKQNVKILL